MTAAQERACLSGRFAQENRAMPFLYKLGASIAALSLFFAPLPTADAFGPPLKSVAQQTAENRLLAEFARVATLSDGTVGIAVQDLENGESLSMNGDTLFPMASAYKIAVAGKILSLVDAGTLRLDDKLALDPALASEGGIAWMFFRPNASLTVTQLLELMLTRSDNNATDVLVARAGGPQAVNAWVAGLGIKGLRVDSNTAHLLYRAMGLGPLTGRFGVNVAAARRADPTIQRRDIRDLPNIPFAQDPRDTATPLAMNQLLVAYHSGKALKAETTELLFTIMTRCQTGKARLAGMLPPGTVVAHKTGSLNGTGNDVGIVRLPDGRMFAITVFVMKDSHGHVQRDHVIAQMARAAYDYFLFAPERRAL